MKAMTTAQPNQPAPAHAVQNLSDDEGRDRQTEAGVCRRPGRAGYYRPSAPEGARQRGIYAGAGCSTRSSTRGGEVAASLANDVGLSFGLVPLRLAPAAVDVFGRLGVDRLSPAVAFGLFLRLLPIFHVMGRKISIRTFGAEIVLQLRDYWPSAQRACLG